MESFHPTPVVPSNAPLWTELDQDSRVLREQCGNRQLGYIPTQQIPDYFASVNNDSACASAGARAPSYMPQFHRSNSFGHTGLAITNNKYDRNAHRLFNNLTRRRYHGMDRNELNNQNKDREAEYNARLLAARFARCDGYIKYRNRQPKEKKGNKEDQKWPDHIEDAFIIALCRHPPCGRKKFKPPGEENNEDAKAMGRNELIADYILRNTGEGRSRKQVSSHIQVLKPFVQNEKIIMRFLATPSDKESAATKAARKKASEYTPGSQLRTGILDQHQNHSLQTTLDLQPHEFCMFMRQESEDTSKTLHTYSTTDQTRPTRRCVQTQAELYGCFPGLANVPAERFSTGVFLALHVPILLHPQDLVGKTELAISWVLKARACSPPVRVSSRTQLYLHGRPIFYDRTGGLQFFDNQEVELTQEMQDDWANSAKEFEATEVGDSSDIKNESFSSRVGGEEGKTLRYYVPFSSTFWARYLWHVAMLQRSVSSLETRPLQADESTEDRQNAIQKKRLEVSSALGELTAVQEIVATSDDSKSQVVLTVHFTFSHATDPKAAITTWENLDFSTLFDDAVPMSAGGICQVSQSTSDSQESQGSIQTDAYCGSSYDFTSFDGSGAPAVSATGGYPDPDSAAAGLASPINLNETQASNTFGSSWFSGGMLPASAADLNDLGVNVLDPLLPHTQSGISQNVHEINDFDFSGGNISISLDSSALKQPSQQHPATSSFASHIDALDLELSTDPLLLQPSRTTTPWIQSSNATPTDYTALFSQPHSPATAFPDFNNRSQSDLAAEIATVTLPETSFDASLPTSFNFNTHQAFAGAGISELDATSHNQSRQQSFSAQPDLDPTLDAETNAHESLYPSHQNFEFKDEFSQGDEFASQEGAFNHVALAQANDGFVHSFDVGTDSHGLEVGELGHEMQHQQNKEMPGKTYNWLPQMR